LKIILFLSLSLFCANSRAQNKSAAEDKGIHIPYDTIHLKKGYLLVFEKTDLHRYLRLKGPSVDTIIRQINIKAPESNLGYIDMDHDSYFALLGEMAYLGISMQLFQKATGKKILDGCIIEKDTIQKIVYYAEWDGDRKQCIFHTETMKVEMFPSPKTSCSWWWDCLVSKKITDTELTIEYYTPPKNIVKKTYPRQQD